MTRETVTTEEITYTTQVCEICEREVATDSAAPIDTFEPHGYAVILGEGKFRQEVEYEGNWDKELYFELEKEDTQLPTVEGYIICEDCAQSIHQYPKDSQKYTGKIPDALRPDRGNLPIDRATIIVIVVAILLLLLVLLL